MLIYHLVAFSPQVGLTLFGSLPSFQITGGE
ncbi:uncharacterized protein METZ01_LOCUS457943 [marine metagenome]|uniref:Uncharacterized protein n=1 Tax=marine metagenome TaxID=408172 RepID=A0A383ABY1_9ZZZZ